MAFAYSNFAKINEKVKVFCTAHGHRWYTRPMRLVYKSSILV